MQPEVTLICSTYNHEKYIAQALDSFVKQETNFKFEIVVHDDCSTDGTKEIIKKYVDKYPDLIRPMYEEENQYSKGKKIGLEIVVPTVKSKYICFCEGDDFLISNEKLQKQYDYMESHPDCSMCSHGFVKVNKFNEVFEENIGNGGNYSLVDVLKENVPLIHTSSMFFRTDNYRKFPDSFKGFTIGDHICRLYMATLGYIHYISEKMSAYRVFSDNSWSTKMGTDVSFALKNRDSVTSFFHEFNKYTDFKYDDLVKTCIDNSRFRMSLIAYDYKTAKATKMYSSVSIKQKVIINIGIVFPKLMELIIKKRFKIRFKK